MNDVMVIRWIIWKCIGLWEEENIIAGSRNQRTDITGSAYRLGGNDRLKRNVLSFYNLCRSILLINIVILDFSSDRPIDFECKHLVSRFGPGEIMASLRFRLPRRGNSSTCLSRDEFLGLGLQRTASRSRYRLGAELVAVGEVDFIN